MDRVRRAQTSHCLQIGQKSSDSNDRRAVMKMIDNESCHKDKTDRPNADADLDGYAKRLPSDTPSRCRMGRNSPTRSHRIVAQINGSTPKPMNTGVYE